MKWWQNLIYIIVIAAIIIAFIFVAIFAVNKPTQLKVIKGVQAVAVETEETTAFVETTVETAVKKVTEEEVTETIEAVSIIPEPYESEGGIPYNGSEWTCDVAPDEIECLSVGPGESAGVEFKGGANPDRGGIFIFLPGKEVIRYQVKKLIEGSNWHGAYDYNRTPTEEDWKLLVEDRIQAMMQAPNGTSGKGCQIVDVAVISDGKVIFQKTYQKQ